MALRVVARTGGSNRLSALPTGGSKCVQAQPARCLTGLPDMHYNDLANH